MDCIKGCGACCIAPSISSLNKPAGVRCQHLSQENTCLIFNKPERPKVCSEFKACDWICGQGADNALQVLIDLESATQ
ncbi:hypothetical protein [Catenovulum maritimum]|uniref:YkgJ family cysteine cluster protein n=1 Tax=Catenovulum maritimum TaxID=1513271 RepID=A0A0J8GY44_9ALTE|nr:hypothetical protein [Catenovulum maritimum]KMT66154.1 hypothetical protein XM47_05125 [Catenovulum maritimum]